MESPKTRVNFSMLPKYAGQYVCVVGKNLGVSAAKTTVNLLMMTGSCMQVGPGGTSLSLETCDQQKMTAHFAQPIVGDQNMYQ